jgi:hypothetical protein
MANLIDYAWAAGFHEGEGHISLRKNGGMTATISQCNPEPLVKMQDIFGGSLYGPKEVKNGNKPVWVWSLNNVADTKNYVYCILPWLSFAKASDALDKVEYWANVHEVKLTFCSKGHNKDIVGRRKTGRCIACELEYKMEKYEPLRVRPRKVL